MLAFGRLLFVVMLKSLVGLLLVASAFADELKVDVISVPEICEEKSKAGDTVRLVSLLQFISPTPYFLLNILPKRSTVVHLRLNICA